MNDQDGTPDEYVEGESAYFSGEKISECPYTLNSPEGAAWAEGYLTAKKENEPGGCCD